VWRLTGVNPVKSFRPGDTSFSGCLFARLSFVPLFFPLVDRAEGG